MFLGYFCKKRRFLFYLTEVFPPSLLFDVSPHSSVSYHRVFTFILYFQPSSSQSDSRHFQLSFLGFYVTPYRECCGFERAFFTHSRFLLCAPSPHFDTFCGSDAGRNIPSRISLWVCPHNVVSSGWCMVLIYLYCRYKTIGLPIAPVIVTNCFNETTFKVNIKINLKKNPPGSLVVSRQPS